MSDTTITRINLSDPISPEMNMYFFFQEVAEKVEGIQMEVLEYLVASATSRGWFPEIPNVVSHFGDTADEAAVHTALTRLQELRLLYLKPDGGVDSIVCGITHTKTSIRVMTADKVPFHVLSALDSLAVASTIQKTVTITAQCAMTDTKIQLTVNAQGELVETSPNEITAFVPGWDGTAPIPEILTANGHFFKDDEQLQLWMAENGEPDGMPLTQDTIRSVGMEMAGALAAIYTRISIR